MKVTTVTHKVINLNIVVHYLKPLLKSLDILTTKWTNIFL